MHVLIVSDSDSKYGAPHSMKQMVSALKNSYGADIQISVLLLKAAESLKEELEAYGAHVDCIYYDAYYQAVPYDAWKRPLKYVIKKVSYLYGKYIGIHKITQCIDMSEIDIIHSNSSREDLGALLAEKYHKPHLWHIRELGNKHCPCFSYRKDYVELMNRTADKLVAVSDAVRKYWIQKGICREKIQTVYNGVEYKHEDDIAEVKNRRDNIKIIMMGSVSEAKGQIQLITAVAHMKEEFRDMVSVDIVGSGPKAYLKKLQNDIEKKGLGQRVHLKGYIADSANLLKQYHLGVMCSRSEGFGRVTAEYMMAGLAVIASDSGANGELIRDGVDGLLYQYGVSEDLGSKITFLCKNQDKMAELGRNARSRALANFTAEINAKNIYRLYEEIISENEKRSKGIRSIC